MKSSLRSLILSLLALVSATAHAYPVTCEKPWVFFDLGANTLIDTQTFDFNKIFYMPGALEYLRGLRKKGYHLGLIINVPEDWGKEEGGTQMAKLKATQEFIAKTWTEPKPFAWELFDLGPAFPPTDAQRKPAPFLFEQAVSRARGAGCDAVYQGTLADEIPAARAAGMVGIRLGQEKYDGQYYYPEARLRKRDFPAAALAR